MEKEQELVTLDETTGQPMTTSLTVAEVFGKEHRVITRAIQTLDCSEEFGRSNFVQSKYLNKQNKLQPYYEMTKDGFTFLAMGFTGAKAAEFKERYIAAFNAMEKRLSTHPKVPQSFAEALLLAANQQKQIEEQQLQIEQDAPKVESYDFFLSKDGTYSLEEAGKHFGYNKITFPELLRKKGILSKQRKGSGKGFKNFPRAGYEQYFKAVSYGYESKDGNKSDTNVQYRVTKLGMDFLKKIAKEIKGEPCSAGSDY